MFCHERFSVNYMEALSGLILSQRQCSPQAYLSARFQSRWSRNLFRQSRQRSLRRRRCPLTEHDVLKGGKPLYTINRTISELDHEIFTDGSHIIYVNGEIRNETALGELMQDFFCKDPREMHYKVLSDRAGYFKDDKEGVDTMCKLMEDYGDKRARLKTMQCSL